MTLRPNSAAIGGTSSTPPVEEYRRIARVSVRKLLQVGADFLGARNVVDVGMARSFERRIGDARQDAPEVGGRLLFLEQAPQPGVSGGHKQQNGDDGAHRELNHTGLQYGREANLSPRSDRHGGIIKDSPAPRFHNWYDAMAF